MSIDGESQPGLVMPEQEPVTFGDFLVADDYYEVGTEEQALVAEGFTELVDDIILHNNNSLTGFEKDGSVESAKVSFRTADGVRIDVSDEPKGTKYSKAITLSQISSEDNVVRTAEFALGLDGIVHCNVDNPTASQVGEAKQVSQSLAEVHVGLRNLASLEIISREVCDSMLAKIIRAIKARREMQLEGESAEGLNDQQVGLGRLYMLKMFINGNQQTQPSQVTSASAEVSESLGQTTEVEDLAG